MLLSANWRHPQAIISPKIKQPRSSYPGVLCKKGVQNSQENTCVGVSFFIKLQASNQPAALLAKGLQHRCFPMNFGEWLLVTVAVFIFDLASCFYNK